MAFPTTSLLDDFNRASLGANWTTFALAGTGLAIAGSTQLHRGGASYTGAYYNVSTYGPDCEAYIDIVTGMHGSANYFGLWIAASDFANGDGFKIACSSPGGTDLIQLFRSDNNVTTQIGSNYNPGTLDGIKVGIERIGTTISVYTNEGSGWVQRITGTDSAYPGAGNILVDIFDTADVVRLDNLGGGTIAGGGPPPANTTPPVVTGNTRQNDIVTTDDGSWTNSPTGFTYQWQRENSIGAGAYTNISGETANQYVVRYADKDLHVRCNVTASNAGGSATQASNEVGPGAEVSIWRDDFARSAGAIGLPWSPTPWPGGTDVSPTINGSQHVVDPSTASHFGATSHLIGGPFHGRIRLECQIPTKVSVSDVALDYCLDVSSKDGYRWQIDSDSGDFLRLWKHVTLGSFTAIAGPYAYSMASGQGLWVEYDPRTGRHIVGVIETSGAHTQIDSVVDVNVGGVGPFTSGYAGLGLEIASGSSSSEVGSFTLTQLDVGSVHTMTFTAIPFV